MTVDFLCAESARSVPELARSPSRLGAKAWLVNFMDCGFGWSDLEEKTLQLLEKTLDPKYDVSGTLYRPYLRNGH